jgi:glycosyltransferase involved in cell wall biosynthesis
MGQSSSFPLDHIWCAIPVYNNQATVKSVAMECHSIIPQVVVVDDGSTDADVEKLLSDSGIVVLRHEKNRGKGEAILTALRHIEAQGGRFMITIDGDGQHYPRDLEKFIPLLQEDDTSIVIGCRRFEGDNVPRKSRLGREIGNSWLRIEAGVSIEDCQSGFRAYPVKYLSQLKLNGSSFDFEVEVLARAVWAGLTLRTIAVDVWYPEPRLRVSSFRPVVDNFRIACMHARLVGRRLLPFSQRKLVRSVEDRLDPRVLLHPIKMLRALLSENAAPGLLGVSAAVGVFVATLPILSLHTVVILYIATRLRLNRMMAVSIQHLCMPPFVPMICIELGYRIRYGQWLTEFSKKTVFSEVHHRLFEWLLGSLVVAPVGAVLVGGIVFLGARAIRSRAGRRRNGAQA